MLVFVMRAGPLEQPGALAPLMSGRRRVKTGRHVLIEALMRGPGLPTRLSGSNR